MLRMSDARIGYGPVTVVRDLDLEVANEAVFVVGPNGAGKTTLIRGILGLSKMSRGTVHWLDDDITRMPPHARARLGIGVVPEGRRVFGQLTVRENLEVAARVNRARPVRPRLDAVLDRFPRLGERLTQPAGLLSGGEQQMLAIGRALVQEPRLLLIDELSLGLAPVAIERVADAVRSLAAEGLGILLVEQNARLAMSLCSRGHLMSDGRIVLSGTVAELSGTTAMRDLYLGGLEGSVPA